MAIVLPHGVLFRGDADGDGEGKIRRNLIENNHIEAIIGLPANIFFGTGIPTIIMILRQKRETSDVLFVDASGEYIKDGKQNRLRASNIRRIADAVIHRADIPHFSRLVSKEEIRANGYNLNIPRYIESGSTAETWDIYASLYGGLPEKELDALAPYWNAFPGLRDRLFLRDGTPYARPAQEDMAAAVRNDSAVTGFLGDYRTAFDGFSSFMAGELLDHAMTLSIAGEEETLWQDIRRRLEKFPLVDPYGAYQRLDDAWNGISLDLETLQNEGWDTVRSIEPRMTVRQSGGRTEEVQDGWEGRILPFALVAKVLFRPELDALDDLRQKLDSLDAEKAEILESLPEEEKDGPWVSEDGTAFNEKGLDRKIQEIYADSDTPAAKALAGYLALLAGKAGKEEKLAYIGAHPEAGWDAVEGKAPYAKGKVQTRLDVLRAAVTFPEDSAEGQLLRARAVLTEEKEKKSALKTQEAALLNAVRERIPRLTDEEVRTLLREKWVVPLHEALTSMAEEIPEAILRGITAVTEKYSETALDIEEQSQETGRALASMMTELTGSEYDEKGLAGWKSLLEKSVFEGNKKIPKVQQFRQTMLTKLFPREGAEEPELRFRGFSGKWESHYLGMLGVTFSGLSGKTKADFGHGKARFVPYLNVFNHPIADLQETEAIEIDDKQNEVKYGDIFFTTSSETPEEVGMSSVWLGNERNVYLNSFCFGYRPTSILYPFFMAFLLRSSSIRKKFIFLAQGISRYNISKNKVMEIEIPVPSFEEQKAIGNFFYRLDTYISLQQKKLKRMQRLKAALLEKMFV